MALYQLSYEGIFIFRMLFKCLHAFEGARTLNLALKRRLLFRLSYEGKLSRFPATIRRSHVYETCALPVELKRQLWSREDLNFHAFAPGFESGVYTIPPLDREVDPAGIEPAVFRLQAGRSPN